MSAGLIANEVLQWVALVVLLFGAISNDDWLDRRVQNLENRRRI